jgi:hypothetical protein
MPPLALARVLLLCSVILIGLAVVGIVAWHYATDAQAVAFGLEAARPWLSVWRAALSAALIVLWPPLINWLAARYGWSDGQRRYVTAQRWRVAAWLIVIELVLVQNLVGRFINGVLR